MCTRCYSREFQLRKRILRKLIEESDVRFGTNPLVRLIGACGCTVTLDSSGEGAHWEVSGAARKSEFRNEFRGY
jgi:hypothetical protein